MDDSTGQRTMFVGFLIGFAFYALSFVMPFLVPGTIGQYASIALILVAMVFIVSWFIAVRRGFRITKAGAGPNRAERRAKQHSEDEREKLRKARLRR